MGEGRVRGSGPGIWVLAVVVTLASAYYQRATGPTHPVRVREQWQGQIVRALLDRSHGGQGDQRVEVLGIGPAVSGTLIWRRYPTREPFFRQALEREGERLVGLLPHQPPAGKLEYRIELRSDTGLLPFPATGTIVTRFKGHVPLSVLIPHIIAMFVAMLLSNRAGITAAMGAAGTKSTTAWTLGLLVLGGLILGPVVQKLAFGSYWTGVPFGWDLTDNKTLISVLAWAAAFRAHGRGKSARRWTTAAAAITLIVFLIPHSILGSELKYEGPVR